jgi:hypothetical protein
MGRLTISIDDVLLKRLDYFLSKNRSYEGYSDFYQRRTDEFLNPDSKYYISIAMLYLGYPFIILTILLIAAADTHNVLYHYISSLIIGILLAGLYLMARKYHGRK